MHRMALVIGLLAAGCGGGSPSDCERAVHHVTAAMAAGTPRGSEPSAEEAEAIKLVEASMVKVCEGEGLSKAQLDCIVAAKSLEDFPALAKCPAIAAHRPSWLLVGPP